MDLWGGSQGTSVHVQLDLLQSHSILAVFFGCELPSLEKCSTRCGLTGVPVPSWFLAAPETARTDAWISLKEHGQPRKEAKNDDTVSWQSIQNSLRWSPNTQTESPLKRHLQSCKDNNIRKKYIFLLYKLVMSWVPPALFLVGDSYKPWTLSLGGHTPNRIKFGFAWKADVFGSSLSSAVRFQELSVTRKHLENTGTETNTTWSYLIIYDFYV